MLARLIGEERSCVFVNPALGINWVLKQALCVDGGPATSASLKTSRNAVIGYLLLCFNLSNIFIYLPGRLYRVIATILKIYLCFV